MVTAATKNCRFYLLSTPQRRIAIRKWLAKMAQQVALARELRKLAKHHYPDGKTPDGFDLDEVDWVELAGMMLRDRV